MNLKKLFIFLILVLFSASASAQFYRYVDKEGNILFTDDLSLVPKNQRAGVREYFEVKSDTDDEKQDAKKAEKPQPLAEEKQAEGQYAANGLDEIARSLDRKKEELEKEYKAMMKEKEQLEKDKIKIRSKKGIKKYNEGTLKLNEKIENYEIKREAFNVEVGKYNAMTEKDLKDMLEKKKRKQEEKK